LGRVPRARVRKDPDAKINRGSLGAVYATGWTISGLAVPGAIVAVWILGI
jgi:hypothetical protein